MLPAGKEKRVGSRWIWRARIVLVLRFHCTLATPEPFCDSF